MADIVRSIPALACFLLHPPARATSTSRPCRRAGAFPLALVLDLDLEALDVPGFYAVSANNFPLQPIL